MTAISRAPHLFAQPTAILISLLVLVGNSQLSTSHEAATGAKVHMLPRTDPLEMNNRIQHPVFAPTPGGRRGGGRYLLDRILDRTQNQSGRGDQKALPLPGIEHRSNIAQPRQCTDYGIPAPCMLCDPGTLPSMGTNARTPSSSHGHHTGLFTGDKVKVNLSLRKSVRHTGKQRYSATQS